MIQMAGRRVARDAPRALDFRSPGLELVLARLEAVEHPMVLDLGAPRRSNVEFLGGSGCKVWIEDLPHFLVGQEPPPPDDPYEATRPDWDALARERLAFDREARFDVVLAWDLFAYLAPEAIRAVMRAVAPSCKTGTLLFITASTESDLGEQPAHVSVSREGRLVYEPSGPPVRPNPAHTPLALERMMPGFRLLHSFLLGEGMQDYLFSFEGG